MSRIRANTVMNQSGDGAPDFPYGFTATSGSVTGLLTATTYDVTQLQVGGATTITGAIQCTDTTASTSTTTGALSVSGGVGIAKSVYIGSDLDVGGSLAVGGTITYDDIHNLDSIGVVTARTGIEVTAGGINVTAGGVKINQGGLVLVGVTTGLSISGVTTASGNVVVTGSVEASTTGWFGGVVTINDTTQSHSKDTGAFILNGGIGCEKNLNVGTAVTMEGLGISTFSQGMKIGGGNALQEKCHIETTSWHSNGNINLDYGMVHLNTTNLGGTATLNITSSVGINTSMVNGDIIAVTGITSVNSSSAYVNALQIDHSTVSVQWAGGSAPSEGGSSGYDTYCFNIIKTANAAYAVIGNHIKTS